jgi:hypothetical protein
MNKKLFLIFFSVMTSSWLLAQTTTPTDAQLTNAKSFVHQGVKDRVMAEGCAKVDNCVETEYGSNLELLIGKAYALMGVMTGEGGIPKFTSKASPDGEAPVATEGAGKGSKPETKNDYCMMVAIGYETLGGLIQQSLQTKAQNAATGTDAQLQSLVSLKETHKARKTTATLQSTIYGGVTACYAAMAFKGDIVLDWQYWAKVGGATTLTALYLKKAVKHASAMKKVQTVIDSLPKTGDCNPWTGTTCFCSETTSKTSYPMEYEEMCVLNKGNIEAPLVATGCGKVVDGKIVYDQACQCKTNNTCLKSNLVTMKTKIPNVANYMSLADKGFDLVNNGVYDEGKLNSYTTGMASLATKMKAKIDTKGAPSVNLNDEQKKIAEDLKDFMPTSMANAAAASSPKYEGGVSEPSSSAVSVSAIPEKIKSKLGVAIQVNYQQGSGSNSSGGQSAPEFSLPGFPGQQPEAQANGTEIVSFTEQAVSKADVSNASETPIFDIISNRYRRSGWEKLDRLEK